MHVFPTDWPILGQNPQTFTSRPFLYVHISLVCVTVRHTGLGTSRRVQRALEACVRSPTKDSSAFRSADTDPRDPPLPLFLSVSQKPSKQLTRAAKCECVFSVQLHAEGSQSAC